MATKKQGQLETKDHKKQSDIQTLEIDLSTVQKITKDINMITLPFFCFADNKKVDELTFLLNKEKTKKIIVTSLANQEVPKSFDYEVLQVLLKFREAILLEDLDKQVYRCTTWDIAKGLGILSKNKKGYLGLDKERQERIDSSIKKLQGTMYELVDVFNTRQFNEKKGVYYEQKKRIRLHILDTITIDEGDSEPNSSIFNIRFNQYFLKSIDQRYSFSYDLSLLDKIKKTTAKRLYELLEFQRNKKPKVIFSYKWISQLMPLESKRHNRIIINRNLAYLKSECRIIQDYRPDLKKGEFEVIFYNLKETERKQLTISSKNQTTLLSITEPDRAFLKTYSEYLESIGHIKYSARAYENKLVELIQKRTETIENLKEKYAKFLDEAKEAQTKHKQEQHHNEEIKILLEKDAKEEAEKEEEQALKIKQLRTNKSLLKDAVALVNQNHPTITERKFFDSFVDNALLKLAEKITPERK